MPHKSTSRRCQFSSCDACRQSRVACDASKQHHNGRRDPCSRCARRKRACTFEVCDLVKWRKRSLHRLFGAHEKQWVSKAKKPSDDSQDIDRRFVAYKPSVESGASDGASSFASASGLATPPVFPSGDSLAQCCDGILHHGLETVFGLSLGRYGCPFMYVRPQLELVEADVKTARLTTQSMQTSRQYSSSPSLTQS